MSKLDRALPEKLGFTEAEIPQYRGFL
jgi:hypothetical protein